MLFQLGKIRRIFECGFERDYNEPGSISQITLSGRQPDAIVFSIWRSPASKKVLVWNILRMTLFVYSYNFKHPNVFEFTLKFVSKSKIHCS